MDVIGSHRPLDERLFEAEYSSPFQTIFDGLNAELRRRSLLPASLSFLRRGNEGEVRKKQEPDIRPETAVILSGVRRLPDAVEGSR